MTIDFDPSKCRQSTLDALVEAILKCVIRDMHPERLELIALAKQISPSAYQRATED